MKKWLPWVLGAIVLLLLAVRGIYRRGSGMQEEREWFIAQLHYDFSARIDSIEKPRRAFIHITGGSFDPNREWELQKKLKYNAIIEVVVSNGSQIELLVPYKAEVGDSLHVSSDEDLLSLYHADTLVVSRPLSHSLRGRPF